MEKHGIEYYDGNSVGTSGLAIDENNLSDFIVTDVTWNLSDISIEDTETEGFKTITAEQKVEGYRWSDGEKQKRFVNFPSALLADAEFHAAYDAAVGIVQPLIGLSAEDQLRGIQQSLRARFDAGMSYSTSEAHYNDPYGYLVLGSASCAGSARTTGLCLNMPGYSYEHVNENQWSHQWCRVNLNGTYWICDPYGLYAGPEPYAYGHPLVP